MRHALVLAAALLVQAPAAVRLQVRVFDGPDEVTAATRLVLFRAGDHQEPVASSRPGSALDATVPSGLYDAQAIRESDGRVVNIRWAERLVVMAYPDEEGFHLEVINFRTEFGALQVKGGGAPPDVAIFVAGAHDTAAARPLTATGSVLFVAPAGTYDVRVNREGTVAWHAGVDVPRDRTRFWVPR